MDFTHCKVDVLLHSVLDDKSDTEANSWQELLGSLRFLHPQNVILLLTLVNLVMLVL